MMKHATGRNPYKELESHPLWSVIARAIDDLSRNQDLAITTSRDYVVGYLTKHCAEVCGTVGTELKPKH
jgi:hypothetical protein